MARDILNSLRQDIDYWEDFGDPVPLWAARSLLAEIDRLNAELTEARLAAEEAWDAHDEKETR